MEDVVVVLIAAANCWSQVVGTLPREQYIGYLLEEKKDPIYYWFSSTYCNNYKYIANYCNYCCFSIIANYCNYCQLLQLLPIIAIIANIHVFDKWNWTWCVVKNGGNSSFVL